MPQTECRPRPPVANKGFSYIAKRSDRWILWACSKSLLREIRADCRGYVGRHSGQALAGLGFHSAAELYDRWRT
jgi:hypothetical protein